MRKLIILALLLISIQLKAQNDTIPTFNAKTIWIVNDKDVMFCKLRPKKKEKKQGWMLLERVEEFQSGIYRLQWYGTDDKLFRSEFIKL